jgi:hypothetical protein
VEGRAKAAQLYGHDNASLTPGGTLLVAEALARVSSLQCCA